MLPSQETRRSANGGHQIGQRRLPPLSSDLEVKREKCQHHPYSVCKQRPEKVVVFRFGNIRLSVVKEQVVDDELTRQDDVSVA